MAQKYTLETGFNIANVECVKVVTRENTPATHVWKTMTKFTAEPYLDEGQEVTQRVKNTVMGRIKTDDLLSGHNISCEDERFIPEVIALLYTSDRGAGGEVKNILEWKFPNGKGKPVKFGGEDNVFTKQSFEIQTRPESGEAAYEVSVVEKFPYDETTE